MKNRDPNLIISGMPGLVAHEGTTVEVNIVRLVEEPGWSLEVINDRGTSIVWEDQFPVDDAVYAVFRQAVIEAGMASFLDGANVIAFSQR